MSWEDWENVPTVQYGHREDSPIYFRICPECFRYVKPDEKSTIPEYLESNATCKKHGRVKMPFCAWASDYEDDTTNEWMKGEAK
jgi:hypothetical protein